MKSENGFGSVYKKKGKHRRPWCAVVTLGWKVEGLKAKQIRKQIGTFATKIEAREALIAYSEDPLIPASTADFETVYKKWWEASGQFIRTQAGVRAGFRYLSKIHDKPFSYIRPAHIEDALKDYNGNAQKRAMVVLNHVYRYAMKNDIIEKNYASLCDLNASTEPKRKRQAFTDDEIAEIWTHEGEMIADMILIAIYSGWRPAELIGYRVDEINDCMVGGSKTESGKDRVVPINPGIRHLVYRHKDGFPYAYGWYWEQFRAFMGKLGMDHIPHETRHTFATLCARYEVNEYIKKIIIGHSIKDLTERVYTHRTIEDLKKEMNKIPCGKYSGQLPESKVVSYQSATLSATNSL